MKRKPYRGKPFKEEWLALAVRKLGRLTKREPAMRGLKPSKKRKGAETQVLRREQGGPLQPRAQALVRHGHGLRRLRELGMKRLKPLSIDKAIDEIETALFDQGEPGCQDTEWGEVVVNTVGRLRLTHILKRLRVGYIRAQTVESNF
jgi:hypothetical protein